MLSGSVPTPALLAGHIAQGLSTCAANFAPDLQTSMMILYVYSRSQDKLDPPRIGTFRNDFTCTVTTIPYHAHVLPRWDHV